MGMQPSYEALEAIDRASVVIDCTPAGNENKERLYLRYGENAHGFIAQGSEFGFGKMYARGINDAALRPGEDRFIHVVSCNTHTFAVLVDTLALGPEKEDNLESGFFVCMRRANDISQEGDSLPAPKVGKHDDMLFGTHQARDAYYLFKTLGLDLNLYSSAVKLNTQYMHVIHFNLRLKRGLSLDEVIRRRPFGCKSRGYRHALTLLPITRSSSNCSTLPASLPQTTTASMWSWYAWRTGKTN